MNRIINEWMNTFKNTILVRDFNVYFWQPFDELTVTHFYCVKYKNMKAGKPFGEL